ncbi:hypothetical protein QQY79_17785 [Flavobacterium tructae]|uniref:hypothetical protein n=1 Tax=Flavobacterium tructae TaxID=1114873 RepID=UPI002551DB68|nr:hypothetical protein [Flavobacterium tructae]MDL2144383.1 hypothetical protein [Flavobacterium tructae]
MKTIISISILACVLFFSCAKKVSQPMNQTAEKDSLYEVYKIDSINTFFIVYAKRNGTKFKIVSKKTNSAPCNKILVGSSYNLKLKSILKQEIKLGDKTISSSSNLLVTCFTFEGNTKICREEDITDLHHAENLIGLCFVKD